MFIEAKMTVENFQKIQARAAQLQEEERQKKENERKKHLEESAINTTLRSAPFHIEQEYINQARTEISAEVEEAGRLNRLKVRNSSRNRYKKYIVRLAAAGLLATGIAGITIFYSDNKTSNNKTITERITEQTAQGISRLIFGQIDETTEQIFSSNDSYKRKKSAEKRLTIETKTDFGYDASDFWYDRLDAVKALKSAPKTRINEDLISDLETISELDDNWRIREAATSVIENYDSIR